MREANKNPASRDLSSVKRELLSSLLAEEGIQLTQKISKNKASVAPPLSFAQQRMWFLDQLVPNTPFYNISGGVRLEGGLNLEVLERVINEIVRRHEVLRTRYEVMADAPAQVIDPWEPKRLDVVDLTD